MKMKYINLFVIISFIVALAGCENYEEEFGFTSSFGTPSAVQVDAQPGKYALDIQCPFNIETGNTDIVEVGFRLDYGYDTIVGRLAGDNLIEATLPNLEYGRPYHVTPYIRTTIGIVNSPNSSDFIYNSEVFAPVATASTVELVGKGIYHIYVDYTTYKSYPLTTATAFANGEAIETLSFDDKSVVVEININDLNKNSYTVVNLTLTNAIGSMTYTVPFSLSLSDTDITYSDDGAREDYIRVCGVDWAKGNLQYEKGVWKIANTQDHSFLSYGINPDYVEYFFYGDLNPVYKTSEDMPYFPEHTGYGSIDIKGSLSYDIATARLSNEWSIPSSEELNLLANKASYQYAYVERNGQRTYGFLFYTNKGKIARGYNYQREVRIDENKLDELGLFLPVGRCDLMNQKLYTGFSYMSAEMSVTSYGSNYTGGRIYVLQSDRYTYELETSLLTDYGVHGGGFICYQLPIRPVKNK